MEVKLYYCALKNEVLDEFDTYKCILRECWYLLLLRPEEIDVIRRAYKK